MKNSNNLSTEMLTREDFNTFYKYYRMLPNPDAILRKTGKTIEAYRELKNDPHVWACIQSRKAGLTSLEYVIDSGNSSQAISREIKNIFDDIDVYDLISNILEAPLFGFQPFEIIWKNVSNGRFTSIVPQNIIAKPQEWFFYDVAGNLRYKKSGCPQGEIPPPMKIINARYESSYMNPYGQALLSKCYWPTVFKNGGLKLWVKFAEKYGMPMLIGQYSRGATDDEALRLADNLANMSEDSVIVTPSDISINMHEAMRTSSVDLYKELIKYCNSEISKAILSQTLTTEIEMGSYAASNIHFKIRREVIQSDIKLVERTINTVINYIVKLNYNEQHAPMFKVLMNESENTERVDRDAKIASSGAVKFTKDYWIRSYGFKESDIADS